MSSDIFLVAAQHVHVVSKPWNIYRICLAMAIHKSSYTTFWFNNCSLYGLLLVIFLTKKHVSASDRQCID